MLFNSFEFIFVFLPLTLVLYFVLAHRASHRIAQIWLVIASLWFYGSWNYQFIPFLLCSIAMNFAFGLLIRAQPYASTKATIAMIAGVSANLLLLGYFKYAGLLVSTANFWNITSLPVPNIVLPLGISFFSFTQIAYLVDAYREESAEYNPASFSLFVTFFPHLIAGPVLYHKSVVPQLQSKFRAVFSPTNFVSGAAMFTIGLSKKVLVADNIAPFVAPIFDHSASVTMLEAWMGVFIYAIQIFFALAAIATWRSDSRAC